MVNGRQKGQRGEREFIAKLQEVVDKVLGDDSFELHRNLDQTRAGGADVEGATPEYDLCAFEVKRQEKLSINRWWEQATRQARESKRPCPVLAFKQSRQPWRVMMLVGLPRRSGPSLRFVRGEVTLDDFLYWYEHLLRSVKNE